MRCRIIGKYQNALGRPIGKATITIRPLAGIVTETAVQSADKVTVTTTDDGVYVASLMPGEYRFTFPNNQTYRVMVPNRERARFEELEVTNG